ncbi:unnamed protein product [Fraxinus pennsylvanica]|uniref:Uncharacterized protein n=1 Tax=Fraxinus pennsylvanica TaxID=56036 RepID=A0AAD2DLS8_9LAMI|nr:unnamed protein product [Fraxinus pennsylvanica]
MSVSSSSSQEQIMSGNLASDYILSEEAEEQLSTNVIQAGKAILELSYINEEVLQELDKIEDLLSKVRQEKEKDEMKKVLPLAKKALVRLLGQGEMDVKISMTSRLTEIMRITAPNEPLKEDNMKIE